MSEAPSHRSSSYALLFGVFSAVCVVVAVAYVWHAAKRSRVPAPSVAALGPSGAPSACAHSDGEKTAAAGLVTLDSIRSQPHVYYRSLRPGETGRIVIASLTCPERQRWVTQLECQRAHFSSHRGICVRQTRSGLTPNAEVLLLDHDLQPRHREPLPGTVSRARISPDERFAVTTLFVTGDDYQEPGGFSTRTRLFQLSPERLLPDIEHYDVTFKGEDFVRVDLNYWGVTFRATGYELYATLASGGTTHLIAADIANGQARILKENVECPSLSPSGKRLVFKKRVGAEGQWRLHVLDLATLRERPVVAEARSIDDQVEWLDDSHVLYAVASAAEAPTATDLWVAPVDGDTELSARVFLKAASSPAVVR